MQNTRSAIECCQQEVLISSPFRLVLMAYDLAIRACEQEDFDRATRAISVLRDALDYDYGGAAVELFRQYQLCLDCIRKEDYASALAAMSALRQAWMDSETHLHPIALPVPTVRA
jgi:flagellin-specific chaperone FliS